MQIKLGRSSRPRFVDFAGRLTYKRGGRRSTLTRSTKSLSEVPPFVKRVILSVALALAASTSSFAAPAPRAAQEKSPTRDATREKLRVLLEKSGPIKGIETSFRQSTKQPYNFVGAMTGGLKNCESMEIVIGVTDSDTINFRVYPHYKGGYINLDKARDTNGLMRKLLNLSNSGFLFFGADASGDVFAAYTITLESGFPEEAVNVVLASIRNLDQFVGELHPFINNPPAAPK